jgi:CBS domain-containing protein
MLVSGFMIPTEKVVKVTEDDAILTAIDSIIERHISAVVVVGADNKPVGLVTKTDLCNAYKQGIPMTEKVTSIMTKELTTILDTLNRDDAAKVFQNTKNHHAIVLDKDSNFLGLISTWDIAAECAKDARAWPWTRTADGKIHAK